MWTLDIPKADLLPLYQGITIDLSIFEREPLDDEDLITNFLPSKLWRLNNLYTIVNKQGQRVQFNINYAQHKVYAATLQHPRIIILKSRQQGISTFWLISYLDDALFLTDYTVGLMAQGLAEAATLLKRVKLAIDTFPSSIQDFIGMVLVRDNASELGFANGSTLFIRTSFRSATLQRLHVSELGKIANTTPERAKELKTGTLQAIAPGNVVVIESTAEGDNAFKAMWHVAEGNEARVEASASGKYAPKDFKPVFLAWVDDPDCRSDHPEVASLSEERYFAEKEEELGIVIDQSQRNFYIQQLRELGDSTTQEYPIDPEEAFRKILDGAFYATLYHSYVVKKGRIRKDLYDANLDVHVAMDLGMDDTFFLVFFQRWRDEWRVVNEYANSGEGLEHYVGIMQDTGYTFGRIICPHDIEVVELGHKQSRRNRFIELGVNNITVLEKGSFEGGIEQVRKYIPHMYVDESCVDVKLMFINYSKEWDEKHSVWKRAVAIHNQYSHAADAIRYMVMSDVQGASKQVRGRVSGFAL